MHLEILVEDSSGHKLLEILLPQLIGPQGEPHSWRIHAYKGIGKLPEQLKPGTDARKRILLDRVPQILRGYAKTPGIDGVVVVLDSSRRDCALFLQELQTMAVNSPAPANTLFRLAIEEMEAWYFGDEAALFKAYPKARKEIVSQYTQDSICGTWERIADAVYPGGSAAVKKAGWPLPGQLKHEWAQSIGPHLDPFRNLSPSFGKLRDGLRKLVGKTS